VAEVKKNHILVLTDEKLTYCVGDKRVVDSKTKIKLIEAETKRRGAHENEKCQKSVISWKSGSICL
jgi:hypothetical protein